MFTDLDFARPLDELRTKRFDLDQLDRATLAPTPGLRRDHVPKLLHMLPGHRPHHTFEAFKRKGPCFVLHGRAALKLPAALIPSRPSQPDPRALGRSWCQNSQPETPAIRASYR